MDVGADSCMGLVRLHDINQHTYQPTNKHPHTQSCKFTYDDPLHHAHSI